MKKQLFNTNMALAMLAMFSFASCSSSDDPSEDPSVNPGESVKTSFSLSVALPQSNSNSAKPMTRVSEAVAQAQSTPVFRGIDNIILIPFGLAGSTSDPNPVESTSTRLGSNITLPGSTYSNVFQWSDIKGGNTSTVYANVDLPMGTTAFLFYGKAIDQTPNTAITTDDQMHTYGTLNYTGITAQPSSISFIPVQVNNMTSVDSRAQAIADYLTTIANTSITVDGTTVNWSDANNDNNPFYNLHQQFIQLQSASSNSVLIIVRQLYNTLRSEASSNAMASAIIASITGNSMATVSSDGSTIESLNASISNYPSYLSNPIPDGACLVRWNSTSNAFEVNINGIGTGGELVTQPSQLVYPANLQYFANTNIRTSNSDLTSTYTTTTPWSTILAGYGTENGQVTSSTQSVALSNQIQYAVGRLDLGVKAGSTTLKDRRGNDVPVTVSGSSAFPITAVFVAGQRAVNYAFEPISSNNTYTIYDTKVPSNWGVTTETPTYNYTLALETPSTEAVRVAVEFTNNSGVDFEGYDGMIYNGAKFYLVATLNPEATDGSITQPTDGNGNSLNIHRVIRQDFVTKATLTINQAGGQSGLGNAYNTLPDLRNPKLSLGMSVDLAWQTGLTFDVTM